MSDLLHYCLYRQKYKNILLKMIKATSPQNISPLNCSFKTCLTFNIVTWGLFFDCLYHRIYLSRFRNLGVKVINFSLHEKWYLASST